MSDVFECTTAMVFEVRGGVFTRDHHSSVPTAHDDLAAHLAAFRVRAQGGARGKGGGEGGKGDRGLGGNGGMRSAE